MQWTRSAALRSPLTLRLGSSSRAWWYTQRSYKEAAIHSKVQKWGNSLALRIPKAFALEVGLYEDAPVEVSVRQGHLIVAPVKAPTYALADLVSGISRRNAHAEVDLGPSQGREAW